VQKRYLGVGGRIFAIEHTRARTGRGNYPIPKFNPLPEIIEQSNSIGSPQH
jgi:hypothetical protein